jgi:hypothetical protein
MMEKILSLIERLFNLTANQQLFVVTVLAILLAGFSLYVVLTALSKVLGRGGSQ